jgi:hypothetical protein
MANLIAVKLDVNTKFVFASSNACQSSDDLPMYSDNGWENVLSLSRENSEKYALCRDNSEKLSGILSRENSGVLSRENSGALSRENSQKYSFGKEILDNVFLSRENSESLENSIALGRENSGFLASLARETSSDIRKLVAASTFEACEFPVVKLEELKADEDNVCGQPAIQYATQVENFAQQQCTKEFVALVNVLDQHQNVKGSSRKDSKAVTKACTTRPRGAPRARGDSAEQRESKRGVHVRGRPEMQQTARDGAAHWANCVKLVRAEWADRAARRADFRAKFGPQADAAHGKIKSKQECLLRFLQLSADDGMVLPDPFLSAGGFFGWAGFHVVPARHKEFRRKLEGLFPLKFKEDTLKETFRRAGLIPERWQWDHGWRGCARFEFRAERGGERDE